MIDLERIRAEKDDLFASDPHSPLTAEQKQGFKGLNYYPENPSLRLEVEVEPFAEQELIQMQTMTGGVQTFSRYGRFKFMVDGQEAELTIFGDEHGFFLPFVDALAGKETYGAGRYLEPERTSTGRFRVDFNLAYNPYCAYNEPRSLAARAGREPMTWTCPLTPFENRLKVPIRAGEKTPEGDWAEHELPHVTDEA